MAGFDVPIATRLVAVLAIAVVSCTPPYSVCSRPSTEARSPLSVPLAPASLGYVSLPSHTSRVAAARRLRVVCV